VLVLLGIVTG